MLDKRATLLLDQDQLPSTHYLPAARRQDLPSKRRGKGFGDVHQLLRLRKY